MALKRTAINKPFAISVTGHRHWTNRMLEKREMFRSIDLFLRALDLHDINTDNLVFKHGCAVGVDLWFGHYAVTHNIPFELFLPFPYETQIKKGKFNTGQELMLDYQMRKAQAVHVVNKKYHTYGYQKRNKALVDNCQVLLTYFTRQRSGSGNAARYAVETGRWIVDLYQFRGAPENDCLELLRILLTY
jgi:hypothetical protein